MKNIKKKIAIIGAGISGLYLAWKTSKKFDVTIPLFPLDSPYVSNKLN